MKILRNLLNLSAEFQNGAVAIGNFDGVHLGHARIVERLLSSARQIGGAAIVFTFDPHPVCLLRPESAPTPLTQVDRKAELLASLGVDAMIAYPTDRPLLMLEPQDFFQTIVLGQLNAKALVEGPNFCFGRERAGDIETLGQYCREANVALEVVKPLEQENAIISSSRVRRLIQQGEVETARRLMTAAYRIRGQVVRGEGRGAKIGFPTANLENAATLIPAEGVYAARAMIADKAYPAAVNIGPNPTFGQQKFKIEVHLIGYEESIYGETLDVDFLARLRDIKSFESAEALQSQLRLDVEATRSAHQQALKQPKPNR